MGVITISREFGCGSETIAQYVADKTGFLLVNKELVARGLLEHGLEEPRVIKELFGEDAAEREDVDSEDSDARKRSEKEVFTYIEAMHEYIYDLAIRNNLVILGRGGSILFRDYPPSLHVRIIGQFSYRVQRVMKMYNLNANTAIKLIKEQDGIKKKYYRTVFDINWANLRSYNLVLNTENMEMEDAADIIIAAYKVHAGPREIKDRPAVDPDDRPAIDATKTDSEQFMHPSEEEFAGMLDFYRIRWEYEPKTFLLEWDSEGNIVEAFSPDFYLPDQDLYIELTTQKPKQAWKKNKKIKRMKKLYPDVDVRLIDKRGFESLLKKHSLDQEEGE